MFKKEKCLDINKVHKMSIKKPTYEDLEKKVQFLSKEIIQIKTDHKLTKQALQEKEDKYRILFEKAGDAIFFMEAEGKNPGQIIDANLSAAQMHGYTVEEIIGKNIKQLDIEDDAKKAQQRIQQMLDGQWIRTDVAHLRKDGSHFPVEVSAGVITVNKKKYILAFDRDISEYRKIRKDLQEQLDFFQTLIDTIPSPIFYKDDKGIYIGCNKAFEDFTGVKNNELKGKSVHEVAPKKIADQYKQRDDELIKNKGTQTYEASVKYADSTIHDVIFNKAVFYKQEKKVAGLVGVMVDITERKQAEKEKKELENKFYQVQKLEAIGNLSAGIAHDFNNILSGILGSSQLAKLHMNDARQINKDIDRIIKGTQRAAELVQQILTFSRQSEYEKRPLKIFLVVKEALKLLRSSIPSTIHIREQIDSKAMVLADPGRIHQVVMNLCTNAYHAMLDTGGTLTVGIKRSVVSEKDSIPKLNILPGSYLDLSVSDTGYGIDAHHLDKIFDPYFTTKKPDSGTGLGLAVVHGIVEEHNGYIKVHSKKGEGSCFHVFLPITFENELPDELKSIENSIILGTERIMVVDDEDYILNSTKELLEDYGYHVKCFSDGVGAFEAFNRDPHQFDLVITDMTMPYMTGDELSEKILKIRPDIPILLCSGYGKNETLEKVGKLGLIRFMQKPVDLESMVMVIRDVLDAN